SIAVGVATVGMINQAGIIVRRDLFGAFNKGAPASLHLTVSPFKSELASAVESRSDVEAVQARRVTSGSIQNVDGEWVDLGLNAFPDINDLDVNKITVEHGDKDLGVRQIMLERLSAEGLGVDIGDTLYVQTDGERIYPLTVTAIVHDLYTMPYTLLGEISAYVSMDTLQWMGKGSYYNRLDIVVSENQLDRDHVLQVGEKIRERVIEPSNMQVLRMEIPGIGSDPGRHWAEDQINGFLLILQIMGIMAILLSSGLVVNTVSAILVQQIKQIGIMRSMGAKRAQVIGMYLFNVLIFCILGLLIALPLGTLGAWWLSEFAAGFVNFDLTTVTPPLRVLVLQISLGLVLPLTVALIPVIKGTRISIYDAIYQYGLGGDERQGLLDKILLRIRSLAPPIVLALRNTFRNKSRLGFTLVTLTLAGAMFIAVFSTRASLNSQLDEISRYVLFDVTLGLPPNSNIHTTLREAKRIPGIAVAEAWAHGLAEIVHDDETYSEEIELVGLPYDAKTIDPLLIEGRWLEADDQRAIVINKDLTEIEPELEVGSRITLEVQQRKETYEIVGLTSTHLSGARIYIPYKEFGALANRSSLVDTLRVRSSTASLSSRADQEALAERIETRFENAGLSSSDAITHYAIFGDFTEVFDLILIVLVIMAVLLAIVGGLGLTGSLGINILERTREIGVLRAVGASNIAVRKVILIEGITVGILSWILGAILSGPSGRALSGAVIDAVMSANLSFRYSFVGLLLWLLVVVFIGVIASVAPAQRAARLTVREVLDYE
ncbi:MAG: FtsX-like permease family protein, partial [Anaerolineales bacterium]